MSVAPSRFLLAGLALLPVAAPAGATQINSGEASGAYHMDFCPALEAELGKSQLPYKCTTSNGTGDNVARVATDPTQLGYGQLDVFALEVAKHGGARAFTRVRVDDARECVFAVTRNRDITNYGEIAVFAKRLRFVLPPVNSGSAATFRYLQQIDAEGVGTARTVLHASTTDEALRMALSADDTVTFFVQFPDPDNPRFRLIQDLGGHIVPVLDRNILRQQLEDRKIYFAQETQVSNARWLKSGTKVITACTPMVVFTGSSERVSGEKARQDHKDMIATVVTLSPQQVLPKEPVFERLLRRTKEISAASAERIAKISEDARQKSRPWIERARAATTRALDRTTEEARELLERMSKQHGQQPRQ